MNKLRYLLLLVPLAYLLFNYHECVTYYGGISSYPEYLVFSIQYDLRESLIWIGDVFAIGK